MALSACYSREAETQRKAGEVGAEGNMPLHRLFGVQRGQPVHSLVLPNLREPYALHRMLACAPCVHEGLARGCQPGPADRSASF